MRSRCAATSCRPSSPIMSATPNAYWRTCSMRCNHTPVRLAVMHCISLSSFCLEQTLTPSQSTAWELREATEWCHVSEDPNVRKQRPPSLPHKSPLPSLSRTQGRCHVEEKPAAQHMHKAYAATPFTSHRK
ncbi:hypothetical protein TcCL_Unassigned00538 [Trypanosoma cruzi]|nr:hypothetical protein TcCL_Unassigned00538 [Trypanosoma cruzi]